MCRPGLALNLHETRYVDIKRSAAFVDLCNNYYIYHATSLTEKVKTLDATGSSRRTTKHPYYRKLFVRVHVVTPSTHSYLISPLPRTTTSDTPSGFTAGWQAAWCSRSYRGILDARVHLILTLTYYQPSGGRPYLEYLLRVGQGTAQFAGVLCGVFVPAFTCG